MMKFRKKFFIDRIKWNLNLQKAIKNSDEKYAEHLIEINQSIIAAEGKTNHVIMSIQIKPSDPYYDKIKETFT